MSFLSQFFFGSGEDKENPNLHDPLPSTLVIAPSLADPSIEGSMTRSERKFLKSLQDWTTLTPEEAMTSVRHVPVSLRGLAWRTFSGSISVEYENKVAYKSFLGTKIVDESTEEAIMKDVSRTPLASTKEDQRALEHVLKAYAVAHPNTGYCQGMSYVVALCYHTTKGENETFWLFSKLVEKHALVQLWLNGIPLVQLCLFSLDRLIEMRLPALFSHMKAKRNRARYCWF